MCLKSVPRRHPFGFTSFFPFGFIFVLIRFRYARPIPEYRGHRSLDVFWYGNYHRLNIKTDFHAFCFDSFSIHIHIKCVTQLWADVSSWFEWVVRWYAYDSSSPLHNCRNLQWAGRHNSRQQTSLYIYFLSTWHEWFVQFLWCVTLAIFDTYRAIIVSYKAREICMLFVRILNRRIYRLHMGVFVYPTVFRSANDFLLKREIVAAKGFGFFFMWFGWFQNFRDVVFGCCAIHS